MHPHIKQQWLDALRSGEYEQGKGMLRSADNKYCCWGVLQDLYGKAEGVEWNLLNDAYEMEDLTAMPSQHCRVWAGADTNEVYKVVLLGAAKETLDFHNDRSGATFKEIADVIEENF